MGTNSLEGKIDDLKRSLEILILIEVAKSGATRDQARKALGSLDNNQYSKIVSLFVTKKKQK